MAISRLLWMMSFLLFPSTMVLTYHDDDWRKEEVLHALRRIFQLPGRNIPRTTSARIVPTAISSALTEVQPLLK